MKFSDSKTKENLFTAYLRESGAYNEYYFYAQQAKKEGYEEIYNIFTKFANNEQAHAKIWFKLFHTIAGTKDNLLDAADTENFERTVLYSEFAKTADKEGFSDIAKLFRGVAEIEHHHENVYRCLAKNIDKKLVFEKEQETTWQCLNCGHIHVGKSAPQTCEVCSHPQAFFAVLKNS